MCDFDGEIKELGPVSAELVENLINKINSAVQADPDFWNRHDATKPNKFGVFMGTTQHVVFLFPWHTNRHADAHYYPIWDEWKDVIQPIMDEVLPRYGYAKGAQGRIMLAKLGAGKSIAMHVDGDISSAIPHKIHVPLVTGPKVEFWENDNKYFLKKGHAYEVNNRIMHGGYNGEDFDRINLIFDYYEDK